MATTGTWKIKYYTVSCNIPGRLFAYYFVRLPSDLLCFVKFVKSAYLHTQLMTPCMTLPYISTPDFYLMLYVETKLFLPHPRVKVSIVGSLRDREVACSASDRQGSNFESCVWRTVSSQSSHHPQEVLFARFSLYVHKGGLKPDSFHFILMLYVRQN